MLTFEVSPKEQQALDSINKLVHLWNPPTTAPAGNLTAIIAASIDTHESFINALVRLKIALPHLGNVVKNRLSHLNTVPAKNLQELYQLGQAYQGLRVLLQATHDVLEDKFSLLNNHPLESSAKNALDILSKLQETVKAKQFSALKTMIEGFRMQIVENVPTFTTIRRVINKQIVLKNFEYQGSHYALAAQLKTQENFSVLATPRFADLCTFTFFANGNMIPINLSVYPRYPSKNDKPIPFTIFQTCDDGASQRFLQSTLVQSQGHLKYQAPQLASVLMGPYAELKYTQVLPLYFQTMVEIAKNHHCYEIALYIPYDFIDIAYAFGFYSQNFVEQQQCEKRVKMHFATGNLPPLLPATLNQYVEDIELLRPVYFPISGFDSRPIYLNGQTQTTTYKKLCKTLSLLDDRPFNSVLPDPYGFMAKPFVSAFHAIRQREQTGRPIKTVTSTYCKEPLDINLIKQEESLASIGEVSVKAFTNKATILRVLK
ncbi:hypothetical protein [Candidatus Berkiella aquae]|uniref:Uncharacterized protein n=1 Tax=Candidatus Berkiella aquae TaxID=295108 RepID=A0A0Q9YNX4_9GAMM|nr:hypothetical protein [Candidatus Berkiella aquae]MCS5712159.1 hypothetical protein [Candidatus Berkiella aquae]